jgi:peptidyl-prolyl cis-trans isomerase SurA
MPRGLLGILIFLLVSVSVARAQGDIVLLRIGDTQVYKSEFEYYFNRSNCNTSQEFLEDFIAYKAKTLYAKELGLDTFPDFINQKMYYLQSLEGLLGKKDPVGCQSSAAGEEWMELWHVTCPLEQHVPKADEIKAKSFMDSISSVLKDNVVGEGKIGKTLWIPRHLLLPEWDKALAGLTQGEVSKPFYSPIGLHIVCWKDKRIDEKPLEKEMDSEVVSAFNYKVKEVEDALLVMALSMNRSVSYSEEELEEFFIRYREGYQWDYPHYRGAVFHCKNKKTAKAIKKHLKRYDFSSWEEALNGLNFVYAESYRMEYGLFQIGKNKYVDKLIFKCGSFEPLSDYPYTFVMGKKLKVPDSYKDVRDKVVKDYLDYQDRHWNDVVKHKYKVEINEEVLKTVNNSGNK